MSRPYHRSLFDRLVFDLPLSIFHFSAVHFSVFPSLSPISFASETFFGELANSPLKAKMKDEK